MGKTEHIGDRVRDVREQLLYEGIAVCVVASAMKICSFGSPES